MTTKQKSILHKEASAVHTPTYWKEKGTYCVFWTFIFASVVGTVIETVWALVTRRVLESRAGLIYGPFNLVYGIGATLMITLLYEHTSKWKIFLYSAGIGTGFELLCSVFQERTLGTTSWDYSQTPANFQGRVNVALTVIWGILGLVFITTVLPKFNETLDTLILRIPTGTLKVATVAMAAFMVFNCFISFSAVYRQSERREGTPASSEFESFLDANYPDDRLQKLFPSMEPTE